eukprot:11223209-Lingulodinium_polyedra.AAC.1
MADMYAAKQKLLPKGQRLTESERLEVIRDHAKYWEALPEENKDGYNKAAALLAQEKAQQVLEDIQALRSQLSLEEQRSKAKSLEATGTAI